METQEILYQKESNSVWYSKSQQICNVCNKKKESVYEVRIDNRYNEKICVNCFHENVNMLFAEFNCDNLELRLIYSPKTSGIKKREPIGLSLRYEILRRDKFKCVICGKNASETILEIDHVIPVSQGGKTIKQNLQTLCFDCNRGKRDK